MTLSLFDYLTVKIYFVTHIFSRFSFNIFEVETMFAKITIALFFMTVTFFYSLQQPNINFKDLKF